MEGHGFSISEKLAVTHLKAGDGKLVRGVVVLKDIKRGETLCNLPVGEFLLYRTLKPCQTGLVNVIVLSGPTRSVG